MSSDKLLTFVIIYNILSIGYGAIPITNPVLDLYGNITSYSWTNTMVNWSCVIDVTNYDNNFDKAQDEVINSCPNGGVLYYPSGTYTFTTNINAVKG